MPKGIDNLPERTSGGRTSYVKVMDDGEFIRLRFLTDGDEVISDYFHRLMQGKKFKGFALCPSSVGKDCELCEEGDTPQLQFLAHVFEYEHYYNEAGQNRKKTKIGQRVYYVENVNETRLMRYAVAHMRSIKLRWERNGTLLDRDFEWIRSGKAGDTRPSYTLEPLDPTAIDPEIKDLIDDLPDLEEQALASLQGKKPAVRRVTSDDDEDEAPKRGRVVEPDDDNEEEEPPF